MERAVDFAKAQKRLLRGKASELRKEHLRECLLKAKASNDEARTRGIKAKMEQEGQKKMWYFINRSQKDPRSKAVRIVQQVSAKDGAIKDSTTKEDTEDFIFAENEYRFQLANDTPISGTKLIEQLGYLVDFDIAQQIVEGSSEIPDELDDATALILEEMGRIGVQLSNGEVTIKIIAEEFQYFWKKVHKNTTSSVSGIHYGHYKAAAHSKKISEFLAKKITLVSQIGCPPERWSYGLTVMLEKMPALH